MTDPECIQEIRKVIELVDGKPDEFTGALRAILYLIDNYGSLPTQSRFGEISTALVIRTFGK